MRKNLRVSENGIVDLTDGRVMTCRTEAEVYATLGLAEIPPEMRVGLGELEAARDGTLPAVVGLADLRGDLHMHSTWSDGADSLEELARAAAARGYEYLAVIGAEPEAAREVGGSAEVRALRPTHPHPLRGGGGDPGRRLAGRPDELLAAWIWWSPASAPPSTCRART